MQRVAAIGVLGGLAIGLVLVAGCNREATVVRATAQAALTTFEPDTSTPAAATESLLALLEIRLTVPGRLPEETETLYWTRLRELASPTGMKAVATAAYAEKYPAELGVELRQTADEIFARVVQGWPAVAATYFAAVEAAPAAPEPIVVEAGRAAAVAYLLPGDQQVFLEAQLTQIGGPWQVVRLAFVNAEESIALGRALATQGVAPPSAAPAATDAAAEEASAARNDLPVGPDDAPAE